MPAVNVSPAWRCHCHFLKTMPFFSTGMYGTNGLTYWDKTLNKYSGMYNNKDKKNPLVQPVYSQWCSFVSCFISSPLHLCCDVHGSSCLFVMALFFPGQGMAGLSRSLLTVDNEDLSGNTSFCNRWLSVPSAKDHKHISYVLFQAKRESGYIYIYIFLQRGCGPIEEDLHPMWPSHNDLCCSQQKKPIQFRGTTFLSGEKKSKKVFSITLFCFECFQHLTLFSVDNQITKSVPFWSITCKN